MTDEEKKAWLDRIYPGWDNVGSFEDIDKQLGAQGFSGTDGTKQHSFGPMSTEILDNLVSDVLDIVDDRLDSLAIFVLGGDQYVIRLDASSISFIMIGVRNQDNFMLNSIRMVTNQDADNILASNTLSDWVPSVIEWPNVIKAKKL
jgi:hypothetical protein